MNPQEKWQRLNNPRSIEDYAISLSENELRAFPAGRSILLDIRLGQRRARQFERVVLPFVRRLAAKYSRSIDELVRVAMK